MPPCAPTWPSWQKPPCRSRYSGDHFHSAPRPRSHPQRRVCGTLAVMPAAPDFRLYQSNSLEVLAGLLADALRTPAPGQALLVPDTILIPQAAMRRWLQASLAQAHGIAANLEFLTPGEFVRNALKE